MGAADPGHSGGLWLDSGATSSVCLAAWPHLNALNCSSYSGADSLAQQFFLSRDKTEYMSLTDCCPGGLGCSGLTALGRGTPPCRRRRLLHLGVIM